MSETFNDIYITRKFAMKKNILVVQSLLLLPLITSSFTLGMEKPSAMQKKQAKVQNQRKKPLPTPRQKAEQRQQQQAQKLNYKDVVVNTMSKEEKKAYLEKKERETYENNRNLIEELKVSIAQRADKVERIDKILAEAVTPTTPPMSINSPESKSDEYEYVDYQEFPFNNHTSSSTSSSSETTSTESSSTSNESSSSSSSSVSESSILASVMLPTEKKGLGIGGNLMYYLSPNSLVSLVNYLIKETFDADNADYFDWLNEAIIKGVSAPNNRTYGILMTIASLCQQKEKYKKSIRISDDAAQKSFDFYDTHYTTVINDLNKALEEKQRDTILQYNQRTIAFAKFITEAVNSYHNDIQKIADNYTTEMNKATEKITLTQKDLITFSALNKSIRNKTTDLINRPGLVILENECENQIKNEKRYLEKMLKTTNKLTTITEPEHKLHNSLALTNK